MVGGGGNGGRSTAVKSSALEVMITRGPITTPLANFGRPYPTVLPLDQKLNALLRRSQWFDKGPDGVDGVNIPWSTTWRGPAYLCSTGANGLMVRPYGGGVCRLW
jgi:hypothetical protein